MQQAHQALRQALARAFSQAGIQITPEQYSVLAALKQADGVSQAYLARITHRDRPGISRLLESLQRLGLVASGADQDDRRARRVVLTESGHRSCERIAPLIEQVVATALAGIGSRERADTSEALRRIHSNLRGENPVLR